MAVIDDIRAKFKGAGFDAHVATKLAEAFALVLANSGSLTVKEGGASVSTSITTLDFGAGFDITESPSGEANITLDMTEAPYDNTASGLTATNVQGAIDELAVGGGGGGSLNSEILADSPFVYFPCNETSGSTLADAIGSDDCTMVSGTISWSGLLPTEDEEYPAFFGMNGRAESAASAGVSKPLSGDLTVECVFAPLRETSGGEIRLFTLSGGNTGASADNTQFSLGFLSTNNFTLAWQTGGGSHVTVKTSGASAFLATFSSGQRTHYVAVRDATANTVDFYVNGCFVGQATYSSAEATDGANAIYRIGRDQFSQGSNCIIGHCAAYTSKLSADRIRAHAKAAGLYAL